MSDMPQCWCGLPTDHPVTAGSPTHSGIGREAGERVTQIIRFVEGMREPDIVRPDEERSLRCLLSLYGKAASS